MGQEDVIKFLKTQNEPLSSGEIAFMMKERPSKICRILFKLIEYEEVNYIEIDRFEARRRFNVSRRMKLYWCGDLPINIRNQLKEISI